MENDFGRIINYISGEGGIGGGGGKDSLLRT